ncbi:hypothetical protein F5888DRAFT_1936375 [Russula emetica]|nr:hypothetical protein F5888DRAFT_1936375 [Russula emetica]
MDQQDKVPYYVLVSPSSQTQSSAATGSTTPVLNHPVLQYHYANDSPLSLLPRSPNEHVLVVDYDPLTPQCTRAQSISGSSAVTGTKVTEAPGAGSAEGSAGWCNSMFVLETTTFDSRVPTDEGDPRTVLAQYKQNNAIIQKVLDYETTTSDLQKTMTQPPAVGETERSVT